MNVWLWLWLWLKLIDLTFFSFVLKWFSIRYFGLYLINFFFFQYNTCSGSDSIRVSFVDDSLVEIEQEYNIFSEDHNFMEEGSGYQKDIKIVNDGLNESIDESFPRKMIDWLEFVVDVKLRSHSDKPSHAHEENYFLKHSRIRKYFRYWGRNNHFIAQICEKQTTQSIIHVSNSLIINLFVMFAPIIMSQLQKREGARCLYVNSFFYFP